MLMAHPTVLRSLVERYEALLAEAGDVEPGAPADRDGMDAGIRQQLQDTVYTLCVSTGTREIGPALAAAREHIERFAYGRDAAVDGTAA
jgi:uncharacterized protein DUF5133